MRRSGASAPGRTHGLRADWEPHTVKLPRQGFPPTSMGLYMKKILGLILVASLAGCSVCKSSDSPEECSTKDRDHPQHRAVIAAAGSATLQAGLASKGLQQL